jgi:hypothetical protein
VTPKSNKKRMAAQRKGELPASNVAEFKNQNR